MTTQTFHNIRAAIPWAHCADDDYEPSQANIDGTGRKNVTVLYDPTDTFTGRMEYQTWAISATATQHRRWKVIGGKRVLQPPEPAHFADGTRFRVETLRGKRRLVEIRGGIAVDIDTGERLVVCSGYGGFRWEAANA